MTEHNGPPWYGWIDANLATSPVGITACRGKDGRVYLTMQARDEEATIVGDTPGDVMAVLRRALTAVSEVGGG